MKVSISHEEVQKGLIFKKEWNQVTCRVQYSELEEKLIKKHRFAKQLISTKLDYPTAKGLKPYVSPSSFSGGDTVVGYFESLSLAKDFESDVIQMLTELKEEIEYISEPAESTNFEL